MADIPEKLHKEVEKILNSATVEDVTFDRDVVTLDVNSTVQDAIKTLTENHVSSVPVYDPTVKKFIGFVDYNDIIELIVECYKTRRANGTHVFKDVDEFLKGIALDPAHPFKSVLNLSRRNPYVAVQPGTKLLDIAHLLSAGEGNMHRVAVEKDGKITKLISQSHIVNILAANVGVFSAVLDGTLEDAGFLKPVATATASTNISDALETIANNRVSGVAVVDDETGKLLGNLSASDIRVLLATEEVHYDFFKLTALQVIQVSRQMLPKKPSANDAKAMAPIVTAHPLSRVSEAVIKLAATRLHRLYIADSNDMPVGVVSLGDVLRYWVRAPKTLAVPRQE
jgi:CBS domain-containing protein